MECKGKTLQVALGGEGKRLRPYAAEIAMRRWEGYSICL